MEDSEVKAHLPRLKRLCDELDRRKGPHDKRELYLDGSAPLPPLIEETKLTRLYRYLVPVSDAPWGSLIIDSKLDRLEVSGLSDPNKDVARRIWDEGWHPNELDSESKLAHGAALLDGRCHALVWRDPETGAPDVSLDDVTQMIVEYEPGSRRKRAAALRRWEEDDRIYATLYLPDGTYKFQGPPNTKQVADSWEKREVDGEDWPIHNDLGVVQGVEIAVNRRLKPGRYPYARGEFAHCLGLLDRINLLTFLGLVVAVWMGFPLRGVTGEKIRREILKDDDGNPIVDESTGKEKTRAVPPFESRPDSVAQFENVEAKVWQLEAADRKNLSIFAELEHLASITKTPRHYFPMEHGMANLSPEMISAAEGGMHAAVTGHKASLGSGWEEVARLMGRILGVELSQTASIEWMKHESRSLAEQADAFIKLAKGLPWLAAAEIALNVPDEQLRQWQTEAETSPIFKIIDAAKKDETLGVGGG